jgi:drug/metabolite transporter (DMT)-like permease
MSATGVACGLAAAALFGASTPLAKRLLGDVEPLVLAALLYLGAALGLAVLGPMTRRIRAHESPLGAADLWPMLGVTVAGGVVAPLCMLWGLGRVSGVTASLLLNLEAPFTIAVAVLAFREHLGRRTLVAALLVVAGAVAVGSGPGPVRGDPLGVLAIAAACLVWALDNNLSQRLSARDPIAVARMKGLGAGSGMLAIALIAGFDLPPPGVAVAALAVGTVSYGLSLALDVVALRELGAAREAAIFATSPFAGALAAVPLLGEPWTATHLGAAALMASGVALLVGETHGHLHTHDPLGHDHAHVHDEHHRHAHPTPVERHAHVHRHEPITHTHPHVPDVHHRHRH